MEGLYAYDWLLHPFEKRGVNVMKININFKRTFKVNGKEYNSVEEMPLDIREAFKNATSSQADSDNLTHPAVTQSKIIFNGTEYQDIDAMPQGSRQLYERVLKSAEIGVAPDIYIAGISSGMLTETETLKATRQGDIRRPVKTEPSFSPRALILSASVVALIILLYYMFVGRW